LRDESEVLSALKRSAEGLLDRLVLEFLQRDVNHRLVSSISIGASPETIAPARDLRPSIEGSLKRIEAATASVLEPGFLEGKVAAIESRLRTALSGDTWVCEFPGREILKGFVGSSVSGVGYEPFRNLILDQMVDDGFEPPDMVAIFQEITSSGGA
jgi:hypothetical protein